MKEFKKICVRCKKEFTTKGAASKYCTKCRNIVRKEQHHRNYEKQKEEFEGVVQRCLCCGKEFRQNRKRTFCYECSQLTEEERKERMKIIDPMTRMEYKGGAERAYYRKDGVIVLPAKEKKEAKKKTVKEYKEGSLEEIVRKLERVNRQRRRQGMCSLSYGKFVAMQEERLKG